MADTDVARRPTLLPATQKGPCAMRVAFAQVAVVVVSIVAMCGCRSNGTGRGWGLPWGRNSSTVSESSTSGPELPSAGAMQDGGAPGNYNYNAPPPGSYDQNAPYDQAGAYGQAGPYDQAGAGAGAYPPPYGGQPGYGDPNAAPPAGGYGAAPNPAGPPDAGGYGATGYPDAGAQANTAAPQNGPYGDGGYPPPAAAAYPAPSNPPSYPPPTSAAPPYQPGSTAGVQDGSGYTVTNPYATNPAVAGGPMPPDNYTAVPQSARGSSAGAPDPTAGGNYETADNRNAVAGTNAGPPAGGYQPGNTGYAPGQTGYAPPGVAPYQQPGESNVVSTARSDPYFRPGSTSDYLPRGTSQGPAGSTDRYGAPSTATAPGWPTGY